MTLHDVKLPACERCRLRKVKCDSNSNASKCTACSKDNHACIIVDPLTHDRHTREAVRELQQKIETLEAELGEKQYALSPTTRSPGTHRRNMHFVGDGSGLDLFTRVSQVARGEDARNEILARLNVRSPIAQATITPHELPPYHTACALIDRYFSHSHLHHPFMTRHEVAQSLHRLYSGGAVPPGDLDLYRVFMIMAISSVSLYRSGEMAEHPYGYFFAAQRLAQKVEMVGSIKAIQNVLLIMRFAMYYHIDSSIWDMSRLCMRQCIELGLHRQPTSRLPPMQEQLNRNVFWDCYVHDRYSSGILDRPYAIAEQDIEVDLPIEASEEDILQSPATSLDEVDLTHAKFPNATSVSLFVIGLRRITARIQTRFFSPENKLPQSTRTLLHAGIVQRDFRAYLDELTQWLRNAPRFSDPNSLYEGPEWYDFLLEKDKLLLIRGAIIKQPIAGLGPSKSLLMTCLECASKVIELYGALYAQRRITWTRSYFQILFTSGLSIIYCLSIYDVAEDASGTTTPSVNSARGIQALELCSKLLKQLVQEMPDVGRFALAFDALSKQSVLRDETQRVLSRALSPHPGSTNEALPVHAGIRQDNHEHRADVFNERAWHEPTNTTTSTNYSEGASNLAPTAAGSIDQIMPSMHEAMPQNSGPYHLDHFWDLPVDLDLNNFPSWPSFGDQDNVLGQMEAGLGEYAWGQITSGSEWNQYFYS